MHQPTYRAVLLLLVAAALPLLHGCAPVVLAGAAASGVLVAEDRRTAATMAEDQSIEIKTSNRIGESIKGSIHLNVTSYNRAVLLTGEVPDAEGRDRAERVARSIENVRAVYNELVVMGVTPLSSRTNDTVITSKVKARFIDAQKFSPLHVKVVTENGVVFLLGIVKKQEATEATDIARTTSGVRRVVRVFEYTD
jgi:osmotically-inducible protein OsmY